MYSEGSGWGAEAGGILGFSCLTPFFLAGRGFGRGFVRPSYRFMQMLDTLEVTYTLIKET